MTVLSNILESRHHQHGSFADQAALSQQFKQIMLCGKWAGLSAAQKDALDMIAVKISRILSGDPKHIDHWDDIAGYATLVANILRNVERLAESA